VTTTNTQEDPPPKLAIAAHLSKAGVTRAAIIDDAYDAPRREDLRAEIGDFWTAVEGDAGLLAELRTVVPEIADPSELTDEVLDTLWRRRDQFPGLAKPLREELFDNRISNLAPLEKLAQLLREAGVEPVPFDSEADLSQESFKLIFIDWLLGSGPNAASIARDRASKLYDKYDTNAEKPFIVLMSSKPADADKDKENFRGYSNLLGGLFDFVGKADLIDRAKLHLHLATWAIGLPTRHDIQRFAEALEAGVNKAAQDFIKRVRSLRFDDYANIQWLSLQAEGHPLGDYMLWLYKSYLAHLLHDHPQVRKQQQHLDSIMFDAFTPVESRPTADLADIYERALTEPAVQDVGPHPRAEAGNDQPYLQLGDLFFKDPGGEVLMVANAACDLAYAPGAARKFPAKRPVLLLHGKLQRYEEIDSSGSVRTELVKHKDEAYRILWDPRNATTQEYESVGTWLQSQGFARKARLALPYALEVQQAFATRLLRIGMPVRPITYQHADIEIYCKGEDGNCHRVGEVIAGGAVVIRRRTVKEGKKAEDAKDEDVFALTRDCMIQIIASLNGVGALRENEKVACAASAVAAEGDQATEKKAKQDLKNVEGVLAKLNRLGDPAQEWLPAAQKLVPLPAKTKCAKLHEQLLWVYHGKVFTGPFTEHPPIVLNLIIKDDSATPEAEDTTDARAGAATTVERLPESEL